MHTNALLIAGMVFGDVKVYRAVESVRAGQVEILSESTLQRQPSVCERTKEGGKRAQIQTHARASAHSKAVQTATAFPAKCHWAVFVRT